MKKEKDSSRIANVWNFMDRFRGDKVILLIALFLMLISVISVFSSTPLLALELHSDRVSIMMSQLKVVAIGAVLLFLFYWLGRSEWYRKISMLGFAVSFAILVVLVFKLNLGFVKAGSINGAWRILVVMGKQIHVYEFVKVFMILYLAWALDTYKQGAFVWVNRIAAKSDKLAFLTKPFAQKLIYIYIPIAAVTLMVMIGSNSSAFFIGFIMVAMILIGGIDLKDVAVVVAALLVGLGIMFGTYRLGWLEGSRFGTLVGRITQDDAAVMNTLLTSQKGSKEYNEARDELKQPIGALLAIQEGGLLGKGIGNSTQKYAVPVIFGDYMFSFIIEETGLWGAAILILLYFSLLARGTMVAKECDNYYDKIVVSGLIILVTGQAFMHMAVNVHLPLVPQTGQTLPLVSHGTNAFIVFSIVFGILLSISKDAHENIRRREDEAEPIIAHRDDHWTQNTTA